MVKNKKIKLKHRWWFDIFRTKEPKIHYPKYKPGETNPAITVEDFDDVESQIPDLHRVGTRVAAADGATDATISGDVTDADGLTGVTVEKQNVEKTRTTRRRSSALSTASGKLLYVEASEAVSPCDKMRRDEMGVDEVYSKL